MSFQSQGTALTEQQTTARGAIRRVLPALICALTLVLCGVLIRPSLEMGIIDDWSYIKSAQALAATGHVTYYGWASAMILSQIYLGALFIKIFGFSFTVVRWSTLFVAMATAFLIQRSFVRAGVREWNASIATLTFIFSPVFLAVTFSFMSDIVGIFTLVICFYACLRAAEAKTDLAAICWIIFASLSNTVGGTSRQISWLGALVMVPSTLWLLRGRRRVVISGVAVTLFSAAAIFYAIGWFHRQPYSLWDSPKPDHFDFTALRLVITDLCVKGTLGTALYTVPILLMFVPFVFKNRRSQVVAFVISILFILDAFRLRRSFPEHHLIAPYLFNNLQSRGFIFFQSFLGPRPILLHRGVRILLSIVTIASLTAFVAVIIGRLLERSKRVTDFSHNSWKKSAVIIVPCLLAYLGLLVIMTARRGIIDRYLLFPELTLLLFICIYFQNAIRPEFQKPVLAFVVLFGALNVVGIHDTFALYHAQLALIDEVRAAGVPRVAIDGGPQYNNWTQIEQAGHVNEAGIHIPVGAYTPVPPYPDGHECHTTDSELSPSVHAKYIVSFDPNVCGGPSEFAPITFHTWYGPHETTLYMVKARTY